MAKKKEKVSYIFVVLTYRNSTDLQEFIDSIKEQVQDDYQIIIVNSYYDDASKDLIKNIAEKNSCVFLDIENKGYSYGNNYGIQYALQNYEFDFLIVSNPDIIIKHFDANQLKKEMSAYGPVIRTKNGKMQNPYRKSYSPIGEFLTYWGHRIGISKLKYLYIVFNKIERELFLKTFMKSKQQKKKVYALHGSFQIFTSDLIKKYSPIFNNNMFLFCEEDWLSYRLRKEKVPMYMIKAVEVLHQEDGSFSQSKNIKTAKEIQKSYMIYYREKGKGLNG